MPVSSVISPGQQVLAAPRVPPLAAIPQPQRVSNSNLPAEKRAFEGGRILELPLAGVPREDLRQLGEMLSGRAVTDSELATLITSDFGRTPMGKAMAARLAADALHASLPWASAEERKVWEAVVEDAITMPVEAWRQWHANPPSELVRPGTSRTLNELYKLLRESASRPTSWNDVFAARPTVSARIKTLERVSRDAILDVPVPIRNGQGNPWIAAVVGALVLVGAIPAGQAKSVPEEADGADVQIPLLQQHLANVAAPVVRCLAPLGSFIARHPRAAVATMAGALGVGATTALYNRFGIQAESVAHPESLPFAPLVGLIAPDILANVTDVVRRGDASLDADRRALQAVQALGPAADGARQLWGIERHGRSDRLPYVEPDLDIEFGGWLIKQVFGEPVPSGGFDMTWSDWALPNGLRVILVPGKGDVVSVQLHFGYGSGVEGVGQRGTVHFAEHLWFRRNLPGKPHFNDLHEAAGVKYNAYTTHDTTVYHAEGGADTLPLILHETSYRLAHAADPLPLAEFETERDVVLNELRQRDTSASRASAVLARAMYPDGHPYRSPVGGRPADLRALQAGDLEKFMKVRQRPNLGTLVISGNLDEVEVSDLVTEYFAGIEPGNEFPSRTPDLQQRAFDTNEEIFDDVQTPRLYRAWNVPEDGHAVLPALELAAHALSQRLTAALANDVAFAGAYVDPRELGGQFKIVLYLRRDADQEHVEETLNDALRTFVDKGPTTDELDSARRALISSMARKQETSDEIASAVVHCVDRKGAPDCLNDDVEAWRVATPDLVKGAAGDWLSRGSHTLLVSPGNRARSPSQQPGPVLHVPWDPGQPNPELRATPTNVNRTVLPPAPPPGPVNFPTVLRRELPNGLPLVLAPASVGESARVVFFFDGGRVGDGDPDTGMGVANLALRVVTRRAGALEPDALEERLDNLGLAITGRAAEGYSAIVLSGVRANLTEGVRIIKDMLDYPQFPAELLGQARAKALANIGLEATNLDYRSNILMERLVFGDEHPYGRDPLGEGTEASLGAITPDTMKTWVDRYLDPSNATIVAVGSFDADVLSTGLAQAFGSIGGARERSRTPIPVLTQPAHPGMHVLPVEEGQQSRIVLGYPVPRHVGTNDILPMCINRIIHHRVKGKLREQQGVTYGLRPLASNTRDVQMYGFTSAVQNDRALDALAAARTVVSDLFEGRKPVTQDELNLHAQGYRRKLGVLYQDPREVEEALVSAVDGGVNDIDIEGAARALGNLAPIEVNAAIGRMSMAHLTWILAGPAAGVEGPSASSESDWASSESEEQQRAGAELRLRLTAMGLQHFTMVDPQTGGRTVHRL